MVVKFAVRPLGGQLADALKAAFEVGGKATLHGASRDTSQSGDAFVAEAVMLQPEHLQVALHTRVGMVIAVVANRLHIRLAERDLSHDRPPIRFALYSRSLSECRSLTIVSPWAAPSITGAGASPTPPSPARRPPSSS